MASVGEWKPGRKRRSRRFLMGNCSFKGRTYEGEYGRSLREVSIGLHLSLGWGVSEGYEQESKGH